MSALEVRLTRISPTHHRFEYLRPDGTGEALELATRGFLFHDLLHFAIETEAGLKASFYGQLARADDYRALTDPNGGFHGEAAVTEILVGAFTGALKAETADAADFVRRVRAFIEISGHSPPAWLTPAFVSAVRDRMRRLQGEWKATPFGEEMRLLFSLD